MLVIAYEGRILTTIALSSSPYQHRCEFSYLDFDVVYDEMSTPGHAVNMVFSSSREVYTYIDRTLC